MRTEMNSTSFKIRKKYRDLRFWKAGLTYYLITHRDRGIHEIVKQQIASDYLTKYYVRPYYAQAKTDYSTDINLDAQEIPHIVWTYWEQGLDSAPKIVRACLNNTQEIFNNIDWDVQVLDAEAARRLADLPDFIWEKHEAGLLSSAHLSDLIRTALLLDYGGIWLDATVLLTNPIGTKPFPLTESSFFMYKDLGLSDYICCSNWLIQTPAGNPILQDVENLLLRYWGQEDIAIQYYLLHLLFAQVAKRHSILWDEIPTFSNSGPHLLQRELESAYSIDRMRQIARMSDIHKLIWRTKPKQAPGGIDFLTMICEGTWRESLDTNE